MKFTLAWLKEHLDTSASLDDIVAGLIDVGLEVEEVSDPAVTARVEAAFKAKYGFVQRVMSFFRVREPTVLRLRERAS